MSLDLYLNGAECPTCKTKLESDISFNFTYNLGPMWRAALGKDDEGLIEIEGMSGRDAALKIKPVFQELVAHPEKYELLNPKNGWGTYEGLIKALSALLLVCKENPEMIWGACR